MEAEPPKERWDTILNNQREKAKLEARQAVEAEWEPYAWAKQVPRDAMENAIRLAQQVQSDPVGFFRQLYTDLDNHPTHAAQLRSEAARLLASGKANKPMDLSPDVEIVDASGQVAGRTFSAERVQAIVQQAVNEALQKEVAPIKSDYEQRRQQAQAEQQQKQLEAHVSSLEQRITKIVGKEPEALKAVVEALSDPQYAKLDPLDVALMVFEQRKTQLQTEAQSNTLKTLQRQAAATSPNPAAAAPAITKRPTSLTDKSLKWR